LKPPSFIYAASRAEEAEKLAKFASSSETWANSGLPSSNLTICVNFAWISQKARGWMRLFRRMPLGKQQWERLQLREAVDRICLKTMSKPSIEALKNHWHTGMDLRDELVWSGWRIFSSQSCPRSTQSFFGFLAVDYPNG
jgi:hypothetical protein